MLETLRYAPMSISIKTQSILYYTLPMALEPGEIVNYHIQCGFKSLKWTGIISAVNENKITVRLGNGPFRGFNAKHEFVADCNLTACYDEMSFQGFTEFPENTFADIVKSVNIIYAISARKDARNVLQAIQNQKQTQSFGALDLSATAG